MLLAPAPAGQQSHSFQTQQSLSLPKHLFISPFKETSRNIYSVMLSLLKYHDFFALRQTKQPPILLRKIDESSLTPPSTLAIQNISLRNDTRPPSASKEKKKKKKKKRTFPTVLPPFCWVVDPATHTSIITSLVGCKLAHPPFWLQPQSAH